MTTLVCFHAHPDDEAIATGGLMRQTADAGGRVVLVCATRGEQGEPQEGVLDDGEQLWERRLVELAASCELLGADAPRWLGYEDSGMIGEASNENPNCFWQADMDEAVDRFAAILTEVGATVVTIYDDHGGYGHPDHIMVHRVGLAACRRLGIEYVYEATINRTRAIEMMKLARQSGPDEDLDFEGRDFEADPTFGTEESDISFVLDVTAHTEAKREAIKVHRSQVGPDAFFLAMSDEMFSGIFGYESFCLPGIKDTGGPEMVAVLPGF